MGSYFEVIWQIGSLWKPRFCDGSGSLFFFQAGRPALGEGVGWRGQSLQQIDSPLFSRWGQQGTRSYGVSVRRRLGKVGQLAFGFEQTRRIWSVQADWMPAVNSAPLSTVTMDWIVASYSLPILYRTEVTLVPGWRLGAGGGVVMEVLPTNAFASESSEDAGNVFALEHNSLRYNWLVWGLGLELGIVREGDDADLHIGDVLYWLFNYQCPRVVSILS